MSVKIFHIIDSLNIGGAEKLLVSYLPELSDYENIIVTLNPINQYENQLLGFKILCVNHQGHTSFISSIRKLKKLIDDHKPKLIHTHLYWSTIIARLAKPKAVPLLSSYHSLLFEPKNKAEFSYKMLWLEKFTHKPEYHSLYISNVIRDSMEKNLAPRKNISVLPNFVDDKFYQNPKENHELSDPLKIVMVGSLKSEKNYPFVLNLIKKAKNAVELDIYGEGPQKHELEQIIYREQLDNVYLKGINPDINEILSSYDLFMMASTFEGFGLALAEAMAKNIPCLVNKIPAFKDVAGDTVFYFDASEEDSLINRWLEIRKLSLAELKNKVSLGNKKSRNYQKSQYVIKLAKIYQSLCAE